MFFIKIIHFDIHTKIKLFIINYKLIINIKLKIIKLFNSRHWFKFATLIFNSVEDRFSFKI